MRRWWAAAVVVLLALLAGCGVVSRADSACLPSPLRLSPDHASPGETVTVAAGPFPCDAEYPPGTRYTFVMTPSSGVGTEVGTSTVHRDGSFTTQVTVPVTMPPGEADLDVRGSLFDRPCDDGGGGSCAAYSALITITS